MSPPAVTVVVPVHGDTGGLTGTLAALLRQDHPAFEVVVVDNGGNDASPAVRDLRRREDRDGPVRLLVEARPGSYAARNAGVAAATAPVLAFTDADCLPRPDWLRRGVAALAAATAPAFVGGRVATTRPRGGRPRTVELYELALAFPQQAYLEQQGFAVTANLLVERAVLQRVGPFDDRLTSGGDREWGRRATALGVRGRYAADAVVEHPCRSTVADLHRKVVRTTRGHHDVRRAAGLPGLDRAELGHLLHPPVRTTLRQAREVPGGAVGAARFALLAAYLHGLEAATRVGLALRG